MSAQIDAEAQAMMDEMVAAQNEEWHPDLAPYVTTGGRTGFPMVTHPLVHEIMPVPGYSNRKYEYKVQALDEAVAAEDWHSVVFLHERPYRVDALIDYVIGRDDWTGEPIRLGADTDPEVLDLVGDVWVDSENINQMLTEWRGLLAEPGEMPDVWIGTAEERAAFEALPRIEHEDGPMIRAWRGGSVGDWSWTTDQDTARMFSVRSGLPVRGHLIPEADVFGYLTRRSESELLVRFTEFRASLVYPEGMPDE